MSINDPNLSSNAKAIGRTFARMLGDAFTYLEQEVEKLDATPAERDAIKQKITEYATTIAVWDPVLRGRTDGNG